MKAFIGRHGELKLLKDLLEKRSSSLVVIYGRRRVGKSRLVEEFGKEARFLSFAGLAPQKNTTTQSQLSEFYQQTKRQLPVQTNTFTDWGDAFLELSKHTHSGRIIVFFDEISWLGNKDPDFLGKLKNAWDTQFKKNEKLIFILCGSVSTWIEQNILSNTGFYGRISLKLKLQELPLHDCNFFWQTQGKMISPYEKLKILAVTGGIPKYLEEIKPGQPADENIKQLCFSPHGLLYNDYDYIFSALLARESPQYHKIVELLADGPEEQSKISNHIQLHSGRNLSDYLEDLVSSGFVQRDYTWQIKTGDIGKLSRYRLSDNYLRFYLKYIKPNAAKIENQQFSGRSLSALPGWSSIMGLQIENLILNNRVAIREKIGIYPDEVICDGAFFQRKTARQKGCQIDYMVQTKFGNLFVCEIKFSRNTIRANVIDEVKEKIARLSTPRNFSIIPVLIHIGEIQDEVVDSQFFSKIIDMASLIE
ncbi:MAG: ATP-binding protein [Gammaproteobacteria bacterium]|nr:ATP-binding protein [Gammaproteobacteria bacterium]